MKQDCGYYFLSSTALHIWKMNDNDGEEQMLVCITKEKKQQWFRRVIFKSGSIPEWRLTELAEDAFIAAWNWFVTKGRSGIKFEKTTYTGLLFIVFKRFYLKTLAKETVQYNAEQFFITQSGAEALPGEGLEARAVFSPKIQSALNKISIACRELFEWKYTEGISYQEIAVRKSISREYCIKMMFRCKQYFIKYWKK